MKPVMKFEADDGTLHDSEEKALHQDRMVKLMYWYSENLLFGNAATRAVGFEELVNWLIRNEKEVKELISDIDFDLFG